MIEEIRQKIKDALFITADWLVIVFYKIFRVIVILFNGAFTFAVSFIPLFFSWNPLYERTSIWLCVMLLILIFIGSIIIVMVFFIPFWSRIGHLFKKFDVSILAILKEEKENLKTFGYEENAEDL